MQNDNNLCILFHRKTTNAAEEAKPIALSAEKNIAFYYIRHPAVVLRASAEFAPMSPRAQCSTSSASSSAGSGIVDISLAGLVESQCICDKSVRAIEAFLEQRSQNAMKKNIEDDNLTLHRPANSLEPHNDYTIMGDYDKDFISRFSLSFVLMYLLPTADFLKIDVMKILCIKYVIAFVKKNDVAAIEKTISSSSSSEQDDNIFSS